MTSQGQSDTQKNFPDGRLMDSNWRDLKWMVEAIGKDHHKFRSFLDPQLSLLTLRSANIILKIWELPFRFSETHRTSRNTSFTNLCQRTAPAWLLQVITKCHYPLNGDQKTATIHILLSSEAGLQHAFCLTDRAKTSYFRSLRTCGWGKIRWRYLLEKSLFYHEYYYSDGSTAQAGVVRSAEVPEITYTFAHKLQNLQQTLLCDRAC